MDVAAEKNTFKRYGPLPPQCTFSNPAWAQGRLLACRPYGMREACNKAPPTGPRLPEAATLQCGGVVVAQADSGGQMNRGGAAYPTFNYRSPGACPTQCEAGERAHREYRSRGTVPYSAPAACIKHESAPRARPSRARGPSSAAAYAAASHPPCRTTRTFLAGAGRVLAPAATDSARK